jgi:uncharacterized protein YjbI with pentapeptide repeats
MKVPWRWDEGRGVAAAIRAGESLKGRNLKYLALRSTEITDADLEGADLEGAQLDSVVLRNVNLRGANLTRAHLLNVQCHNVSLDGADLSEVKTHDVAFVTCSLAAARLDAGDLQRTHWIDCNGAGASLVGANLAEARLTNVDLQGINGERLRLELAKLSAVNFTGARLRRANLSRLSCDACVFDHADLTSAWVSLASLGSSSFAGATVTRARFWWLFGNDDLLTSIRERGGSTFKRIRWRQAARAGWSAFDAAMSSFETSDTKDRSNVVVTARMSPGVRAILMLAAVAALLVAVWIGGAGVMSRIRYNNGLPVATSQLERLDDRSFLYVDRGALNVLRWDGDELRLVKRYRMEYDAERNLHYLDEYMQKAVTPEPKP